MANTKQKVNILVVGPEQSGKSTFVNTLSMTPMVEIDYRAAQDQTSACATPVEFGAFLTPQLEVELRALPSNSNSPLFDTNWAVASQNANAVVVLVPSDSPRAFLEAQQMLDCLQQRLDVPLLVALTRSDEGLVWDRAEVADCFEIPEDLIVYLDPRNYQDAFDTLNCLFELAPLGGEQQAEVAMARAIA